MIDNEYVYWLLIGIVLLVLYMFATKDNPYIRIRDRPQPILSKRKVINWYAWRGPFFMEDFTGDGLTDDLYNKKRELVPTNKKCTIPKYNSKNGPAIKCHQRAKALCKVGDLNSEDWWRNEYQNCSYKMRGPNWATGDWGNYRQCTNNNLSEPKNLQCQCQGRTCETCNPIQRLSQVCYVKQYRDCLKDYQ